MVIVTNCPRLYVSTLTVQIVPLKLAGLDDPTKSPFEHVIVDVLALVIISLLLSQVLTKTHHM